MSGSRGAGVLAGLRVCASRPLTAEEPFQCLPCCGITGGGPGDVLRQCLQPVVHSDAATADHHPAHHLPQFRVDSALTALTKLEVSILTVHHQPDSASRSAG